MWGLGNRMIIKFPYDEFRTWKQSIATQLSGLSESAEEILEYALTEILNNAQDHSGGTSVTISISQDIDKVVVTVADNGRGIFKRIMDYLLFDQPLDAAIELVKGRFTTQPERHTGEGLFFTAQAVEQLVICANGRRLVLAGSQAAFDLIEDVCGTSVSVQIGKATDRSLKAVFDKYCHFGVDRIPVFDRTLFRLQLAQSEGRLVSRSQAKRVMHGLERFATVEADFTGIDSIGQGFADEMFRVWGTFHADTTVIPTHMNEEVQRLIGRVTHASY